MESIEQYYIYISSAFAGILLAIGYIAYSLRKLEKIFEAIRTACLLMTETNLRFLSEFEKIKKEQSFLFASVKSKED